MENETIEEKHENLFVMPSKSELQSRKDAGTWFEINAKFGKETKKIMFRIRFYSRDEMLKNRQKYLVKVKNPKTHQFETVEDAALREELSLKKQIELVTGWKGIGKSENEPLEFSPENLKLFLDTYGTLETDIIETEENEKTGQKEEVNLSISRCIFHLAANSALHFGDQKN